MPPARLARDFIGRIIRLEEQVRRLGLVSKAHVETKTFIIGGDVDSSLIIPWVGIGVNLDGRATEWKQIVDFGGLAYSGSVDISWELDGSSVGTSTITSGSWAGAVLTTPIDLTPGWHTLRPVITSGTATNLSAAFAITTGRR